MTKEIKQHIITVSGRLTLLDSQLISFPRRKSCTVMHFVCFYFYFPYVMYLFHSTFAQFLQQVRTERELVQTYCTIILKTNVFGRVEISRQYKLLNIDVAVSLSLKHCIYMSPDICAVAIDYTILRFCKEGLSFCRCNCCLRRDVQATFIIFLFSVQSENMFYNASITF